MLPNAAKVHGIKESHTGKVTIAHVRTFCGIAGYRFEKGNPDEYETAVGWMFKAVMSVRFDEVTCKNCQKYRS